MMTAEVHKVKGIGAEPIYEISNEVTLKYLGAGVTDKPDALLISWA